MTSLKDLLADPEQQIAFVAELTYRDPDTDAVSTQRVTTPNWEGTESGYLRGLLENPGGRSVSVEGDELSGIAEPTLEPMVFTNDPPTVGGAGPLDFLRDKSLAGRAVTLLAGSPTEVIGNYEDIGSGVADGEPEFNDTENLMTLRLKTALDRLNQDLDVKSYVGEPGALRILTSTDKAVVSDNAAHHLTDFTLAGRFLHPSSSTAVTPRLSDRRTSATAENWFVRLQNLSTAGGGVLAASYSSGGSNAVDLRSAAEYDDGEDHWWVFARRSGHAYLMVDGVVVAETTTAPDPDTPTTGVEMGLGMYSGPGWINDERILNHYIPPDEMRAAMATRASGDEEGLVGLWRGDDAVGGTLTDYSSTGADATISGTENTDFEWVSSDLGELEVVGRSMIMQIGSVWNAPADLVSSIFERWRMNDRATIGSGTRTVRDQGEELTGGGTDYTWSGTDPVIALTAEAGEPLTFGVDLGASDTLREVIGDSGFTAPTLLRDYAKLDSADYSISRLLSLFPVSLGIHERRRPGSGVLREILSGILAHAEIRRDGTMRLDAVVPPVSPGPRGDACLEISSSASQFQPDHSRVHWGSPAGNLSSRDFTVAGWFKTLRSSPTTFSGGRVNLVGLRDGANFPNVTFYLGVNYGVPQLRLLRWETGGFAQSSDVGFGEFLDDPWDWWFLAAAHDHTGGATNFYAAKLGGTLRLIGAESDIGLTATPSGTGVEVGGGRSDSYFRGSTAEPQIWDGVRSLAQLQDAMNNGLAGSETDLLFYAPLDGDSASEVDDAVSGTSGTIQGDVVKRPDLSLDITSSPRSLSRRQLSPAKRIEVRYRRNYAVLSTEQIAASVPADERLDLQQGYRSESWQSQEIEEDYLDARDLTLNTHWLESSGGKSTLRLARFRYGPGREVAVLGTGPDGQPLRQGIFLELNDEVKLTDHRGTRTYRVVGNKLRFGTIDSELSLWR